jgi:peptidoglycan-associated lipoprotein
VLLPDADKQVGKVVVEGAAGTQVLQKAQQAAQADGSGQTFALSQERVQSEFGRAVSAQPVAPEHFLLYFEYGTDQLTEASQAVLSQIVKRAGLRAGLDVSVIGHTDASGGDESNDALAQQRAQTVAQQLRALGLRSEFVQLESFGKKQLLVPTADGAREPRNRRVEVILR